MGGGLATGATLEGFPRVEATYHMSNSQQNKPIEADVASHIRRQQQLLELYA